MKYKLTGGLMFASMLPLLMAIKCNSDVSISPLSTSPYCGNVPVQYQLNFDSESGTYVVLGLRHYNGTTVHIIDSFYVSTTGPVSRSVNSTVLWSYFLPEDRGNDVHVFADAYIPPGSAATIPVAGTQLSVSDYQTKVPATNLLARALRTVKVCK